MPTHASPEGVIGYQNPAPDATQAVVPSLAHTVRPTYMSPRLRAFRERLESTPEGRALLAEVRAEIAAALAEHKAQLAAQPVAWPQNSGG